MIKVIFLDIDGVLNSRKYDLTRDYAQNTNIDETRLPLLKEIVDVTGAKIVLSSTWRMHWNENAKECSESGNYLNACFEKFGLKIYGKTPILARNTPRKDEIEAWLRETDEEIESFVILDDYAFGWGNLAERLVKTSAHVGFGLEKEHVEKAIALLK